MTFRAASFWTAIILTAAIFGQEPELVFQRGHNHGVTCAAITHDGKLAVTGSEDNTVALWDISTGNLLRFFQCRSKVKTVAIDKHDELVIAGCDDSKTRVFELKTGRLVSTIGAGSFQLCTMPQYSKQEVLVTEWIGTVRVYEMSSGRELATLKLSSDTPRIMNEGKSVLYNSWCEFKVVDIATKKVITSMPHNMGTGTCLALSADEKFLAAANWEKQLNVWDLSTGKNLLSTKDMNEEPRGLIFSSDNKYLVSYGYSSDVRVWDISSGTLFKTLDADAPGIALTPDSKFLLTAGWPFVCLRKFPNGEVVRQLQSTFEWVKDAVLTSDRKYLLWSNFDKLRIWDFGSGKDLVEVKAHSTSIEALAASSDGKLAITCGSGSEWGFKSDNAIRIWDIESGKEKMKFDAFGDESASAAAYSSDGSMAAVSTWSKVKLIDLNKSREVATIESPTPGIAEVAFSPDGKKLFAVTSHYTENTVNAVYVWDISGNSIPTAPKKLPAERFSKVSVDGKRVLSATNKWYLYVYDSSVEKAERCFPLQSEAVSAVAMSADMKLAACSDGDSLMLVDTSNGQSRKVKVQMESVRFTRSGKYVYGGQAMAPGLRIVSTGASAETIQIAPERPVGSCDISPDDSCMILQGAEGGLIAVEIPSGKEIRKLVDASDFVWAARFSNDGKYVVYGSVSDKNIKVIEFSSGKLIRTLGQFKIAPSDIAMSQDGKYIAARNYEEESAVLEFETGKKICKFPDLSGGLCFTPDSKFFMYTSGSEECTVVELSTGRTIRKLKFPGGKCSPSADGSRIAGVIQDRVFEDFDIETESTKLYHAEGNPDPVCGFAISDDARIAATAECDLTIRLWDIAAQKCLGTLPGHNKAISSMKFYSNGKFLLTGSDDGTIKFWSVPDTALAGTFAPLPNNQWGFVAADRRFDCSLYGAQYCGWVVGTSYYSADQFEEKYRVRGLPAMVLKSLANAVQEPAISHPVEKSLPTPPDIDIKDPSDGAEFRTAESEVRVTVFHGKEIKTIDLFVNGKQAGERGLTVVRKTGSANRMKFEYTLKAQLAPGENVIGVQAVDVEGVKSSREEIKVRFVPSVAIKPQLWILSIGISKYEDESIKLDFAASDAQRFADAIKGGTAGIYEDVHFNVLVDEKATGRGVKKAISEVGKKAATQDVVIMFLAGHGAKDEKGNYYFIPYDADKSDLYGTAIQWREIEGGIEQIQAQKQVLLADTCHSGEVLKGRNTIDDAQYLVEKLVKSSGVALLVSSTGKEVSLEAKEWGGGAFTSAVIEAIGEKSGKSDVDKDGGISVIELQQYVTRRVIELTGGKQHPYIPPSPKGYTDFPLVRCK